MKDWYSPEMVRLAFLIMLPEESISKLDAPSFEKTQSLLIFPLKINCCSDICHTFMLFHIFTNLKDLKNRTRFFIYR